MRGVIAVSDLKLGFIILLTGFVVVFAVLILLIAIIKVYSTLVYSLQHKNDKSSEKIKTEKKPVEVEAAKPAETVKQAEVSEDTVPGEIVAAIAAAIEVIFGQGAVKIKSIKKSSKRRSVWKSAGVAENTRSF